MKAVVQRVKYAKVLVDQKVISQIDKGFLVLLGIEESDTVQKLNWITNKVANLRIMADANNKMNKSLKEVKGEILVVSQFTLYGDCAKGNRPSFIKAAKPEKAKKLYELFISKLQAFGLKVKSGIFKAYMGIELINDGPVTIVIEN